MPHDIRPRGSVYIGLFLITLATLMHQLLLTRIFSVAMFYHFAFVAISVTMFGMSVGAILVFLQRNYDSSRIGVYLTSSAVLYAITTVVSLLTFLVVPFRGTQDFMAVFALTFTYAVLAVPFAFSGIVVTLALTKFPGHVGKLYATDLIGAALGCVVFMWALEFTDGPSAILVVASLASIGALAFSLTLTGRVQFACLILSVVFVNLAILNTRHAKQGNAAIKILMARGFPDSGGLYDRWNSFSRILVNGDMDEPVLPFAWGRGENFPKDILVPQLLMTIDQIAGTTITQWSGDVDSLEFLEYEVANAAHYLRTDADVCVIGVGGGHDILSALAFNQRSVLGVEINENVLEATNEVFGEFSGHLDQHPKVSFVVDEARSYLARTSKKFDIIQMSLIDTFAATSAGAYVLSENSLYTVEAWGIFLDKLSPEGILSVSRWRHPEQPKEMYRCASLARVALLRQGVRTVRDHVMIVRSKGSVIPGYSVGTILVSESPFTADDVNRMREATEKAGLILSLTPQFSEDPVFEEILSASDPKNFLDRYPLNISAPTENRPFFFQMLRPRDALKIIFGLQPGVYDPNEDAVRTLGTLLMIVIVLTAACIFVPLFLSSDRGDLRGSSWHLVYFASIGFGFMFVEISQLQQLIVFLGHPTYALSVVLFTLLLSGGIGSYCVQRFALGVNRQTQGRGMRLLMILLGVLIVVGLIAPYLRQTFVSSTNAVRIAVAIAIISPMGFFMGMAFPLGMDAAARKAERLTPWLWGTNGASSVCCSVLAMAVALTMGISAAFWSGVVCYVATLIAYAFIRRDKLTGPDSSTEAQ